jgi:hypothetical protein
VTPIKRSRPAAWRIILAVAGGAAIIASIFLPSAADMPAILVFAIRILGTGALLFPALWAGVPPRHSAERGDVPESPGDSPPKEDSRP